MKEKKDVNVLREEIKKIMWEEKASKRLREMVLKLENVMKMLEKDNEQYNSRINRLEALVKLIAQASIEFDYIEVGKVLTEVMSENIQLWKDIREQKRIRYILEKKIIETNGIKEIKELENKQGSETENDVLREENKGLREEIDNLERLIKIKDKVRDDFENKVGNKDTFSTFVKERKDKGKITDEQRKVIEGLKEIIKFQDTGSNRREDISDKYIAELLKEEKKIREIVEILASKGIFCHENTIRYRVKRITGGCIGRKTKKEILEELLN